MIALCLARGLTRRSYPQIGRDMGSRDHATVMHSVREIRRRYHDPAVMADLTAICAKLGERA
jgi:chromosomal replication initiator protein